ncbi:ABC transporter ATP-binding protein [Amycolatopsis taiwanensis]|uniref:Protein-tyrosine-phosphatase n=1 Tax=Amycolatopsis taiwanensis TaxID=342230 RepID=A0A9W6R8G8_9PSEU|nr:ABC transporter ATP-binding protein [Amycolatopsis taiwanensis]GLY71178.1 protein-tyrosine-phosphatase [Amycolatopsis taiwanensis]
MRQPLAGNMPRLFRRFGTRYRGLFALGFVLRLGEMAADLATPWPIAAVIDRVLAGNESHNPLGPLLGLFGTDRMTMLTTAAAAVVVVALVSAALDYLGDRVMNAIGERMSTQIRCATFAHLQRLPLSYHNHQAVGESTSRVITDCDRIKGSLVALFSTLCPGVLAASGYATALLLLDWRFGLIGLGCIPLVYLTGVRNHRLGHRAARGQREAESSLAGLVTEVLNGISTVHTFGRHELHDEHFAARSASTLRAGLMAADVQARRLPLLESATSIGVAVLLWVGGAGVLGGQWSVGHLVVATSYLAGMVTPLRSLSKVSMVFAQGHASAERIIAILDQPAVTHVPATWRVGTLPARAQGRIEFVAVAMDYGDRSALRHLDLSIDAGERIALTGPNGVGKSTALALISGLYLPTGGVVRIDGCPTADLPRQWLHQQVTAVLQDTFLFAGTLADNIRYSRPDAEVAEVAEAAKAALVTDFADDLPAGLDTRIGDRGVGLSGGQRQRVGIARALLADAPIVLLDEPTSGLDSDAEEVVVAGLTRLVAGRTVVMTTHRPSLLTMATRIVGLTATDKQTCVTAPRGHG